MTIDALQNTYTTPQFLPPGQEESPFNDLTEIYDAFKPSFDELRTIDFNPAQKSHIRKLHALLSQLAEVVEHYVYDKQSSHYEKEQKAKRNVSNIQSYTGWQGYGHIAGGVAAFLLSFAHLTELSSQGAAAFDKLIDSWKQGDQFEESLFLQLSSSERQALEGIKNLPQSLQQLILKLLDLEREAISQSRQR